MHFIISNCLTKLICKGACKYSIYSVNRKNLVLISFLFIKFQNWTVYRFVNFLILYIFFITHFTNVFLDTGLVFSNL